MTVTLEFKPPSDLAVTSFSIAVNSAAVISRTSPILTAWSRKTAEFVCKYFTKGDEPHRFAVDLQL